MDFTGNTLGGVKLLKAKAVKKKFPSSKKVVK